ncbi:hypothetical protein IQ268_08040 [Oculatella sp. LEGE 06141]|nr:hypothetical protein [Oculatella sp. LEGE 06141]MBE9178509.1 hypothetical protein [Oculatella sp. LEGE 06141]
MPRQLGADAAVDGCGDDVVQRARDFVLVLVSGDDVQSTLSLVRQGE